MTEDQIERRVEMIMDSLDARLMSGCLSQSDYDQEVKRLRAWAERQIMGDAYKSERGI